MHQLKDDTCLQQQVCITCRSIIDHPLKHLFGICQWLFVDSNEDDRTYMVLNAATKDLRHPRYLSIDSKTKRVVAIAEDIDDDGDRDDNDDDDDDDDKDLFNGPRSWLVNQVGNQGLYT